MAPRELRFATTLAPDEPLRQVAGYAFDKVDRQQIDTQILALQGFQARALLNTVHATYVQMSGTGAKGDVVCSTSPLNGKPRVVVAASSALAAAGGVVLGVLTEATGNGSLALVAMAGLLAPDVTGLAPDDPGWVRVSAAGRCELVSTVAATDTVLGYVDAGGYLRLGGPRPVAANGVTDQPYVLDTGTVPPMLPNARPSRALTATLDFGSSTHTPVRLFRTAAAGASAEVARWDRFITGGAAGTNGTAGEASFYLPDSTPSQRRTTRLRSEWTSANSLNSRAKLVISLLSTDGEHDRFTITDTGAVRLHAYGPGVLHSDVNGNLTESTTVTCVAVEPAAVDDPLSLGVTAGDITIGQPDESTVTFPGKAIEANVIDAVVTGPLELGGAKTTRVRLPYNIPLTALASDDLNSFELLRLTQSPISGEHNTLFVGDDLLTWGIEYRTGSGRHSFCWDGGTVVFDIGEGGPRLPYGRGLWGRNAAADADVSLLKLGGGFVVPGPNALVIGTDTNDIDGVEINVPADKAFVVAHDQAAVLRVEGTLVTSYAPVVVPRYAKASLPDADPPGQQIQVTDDVGGEVPAFSDGTNWRRSTDRAVIS